MSLLDEIARQRAEIGRLRAELNRTQIDLDTANILVACYQADNRDLRERIDHLLDQPLVILNGDAFVADRDHQAPCPN